MKCLNQSKGSRHKCRTTKDIRSMKTLTDNNSDMIVISRLLLMK